MKPGILLIGALLLWCAAAASEAPPPFVGTWKLDVARSRYDPGPPPRSHTEKNEAVEGGQLVFSGRTVYSPDGKTRTITYGGTNSTGQKVSNTTVWTRR